MALLSFIIIANSIDAVLTDLGIRAGIITEANPFMDWLYHQSTVVFFLLKVLMPTLLLFLIPAKVSKTLRSLMYVTCAVYIFVLAVHGVWIISSYNQF